MSEHYHIYIDKKALDQTTLYRLFVENMGEIVFVSAICGQDIHGKIYQGKVAQTFGNGKTKIQVDKNTVLYRE